MSDTLSPFRRAIVIDNPLGVTITPSPSDKEEKKTERLPQPFRRKHPRIRYHRHRKGR